MVKRKSKTLAFFGLIQFFIGVGCILVTLLFLSIPVYRNLSKTNFENLPVNSEHRNKVFRVLNNYFPEYRNRKHILDYTTSYSIFDFKEDEDNGLISFCVDRSLYYFGRDGSQKVQRFSVSEEGVISVTNQTEIDEKDICMYPKDYAIEKLKEEDVE